MAQDPLTQVSTRHTSQRAQADPQQERNNAGGFTFTLTPLQQLRRFLILGTDAGTYYATPSEVTRDNAAIVMELARTDPRALVDEVVQVSVTGAAPRQNPALFALAIAASVPEDASHRQYALGKLRDVARITTDLFTFVNYVRQFRGMGRALTSALAAWYTDQPVDKLAYQVVKYRNRAGWTHRDLLRVAHPDPGGSHAHRALFDWVTHPDKHDPVRDTRLAAATPIVEGYRLASTANVKDIPALVSRYRLSWEMLPDAALKDPDVWRAMLDVGVPITALIRQLPRLTNLGLLDTLKKGSYLSIVVSALTDQERLLRGKVHPLRLLIAQRTYASGQGVDGRQTWHPVPQVTEALDQAFRLAFGAVTPTNKRIMLALDVSGSMGFSFISNTKLTPREGSAAMALVTAATEQSCDIFGFTGRSGSSYGSRYFDSAISRLNITPRQRLDDVVRTVSGLSFGATDCALPMTHALENELDVDAFVIYTDNETWVGNVHPHQALRQYREQRNPNAKLIVVGMTATKFTIADPRDSGMLDVVGFDAGAPQLISDFIRDTLR